MTGAPLTPQPATLLVVRPTLGMGGADRVTISLLEHLDRQKLRPILALCARTGPLGDRVPDDVPVEILGGRLWTAWLPLARLIKRRRPDIVFSTSSGMNLAAALAHWAAGSRARLVLSERGLLRRQLTAKKRVLARLKMLLYRRADLVTSVSDGVRAELVDIVGCDEEKVVVVGNPIVDDTLERLAGETVDHSWAGGAVPLLLAAGRLVPEKDFATLLRAVALVHAQRPVRLLVLGEGPLRGELTHLAHELAIDEIVEFARFDPNPFKYMRHCSVFVLSSRFEGLPGVLIQAMACGAACIATDCPGGPAEIVEHGVTGLLVPVGDPQALAQALLALLSDPDRRASMAQRGRLAVRRFSADAVVPRYEAALLGASL